MDAWKLIGRFQPWHGWLLVMGLAVLLAVAGLLSDPGGRVLGIGEVDGYGTLWFYWYVSENLTDLDALTHTDLFFHPYGKDLFRDTGSNVLDALLAAPFVRLFGLVGGYAVFCVAGLAFSGWAFYLLARHVVDDRRVAITGGLLYALHPYMLYELAEGRPTQALAGLVPLVLLQAWRVAETGDRRAVALGAVLLGLLGYQYWFYGAFVGLAVVALAATWAVTPPEGRTPFQVLGGLGAMLVGTLLVVAPAVLPMMASIGEGDTPGLLAVQGWGPSSISPTTVEGVSVALLTWQPLLGENGFFHVADGVGRFLGHQRVVTVSGVVLFGAWLIWPGRLRRAPVLATGGVLAAVALGPLIVVGDGWLPNPLYLGMVKLVDFLQRLWWPSRAVVVLATLGTLTATVALSRVNARYLFAALMAVIGVRLAELQDRGLFPLPTWDGSVPAGYRCLAEADSGAILELPFGWTQRHLYYQTVHGLPMLGGMLEDDLVFSPDDARELWTRNRFVASLLTAGSGGMSNGWTAQDAAEIHTLGYRWVVYQKDAERWRRHHRDDGQKLAGQRLQQLLGPPAYEDARTAIFAPWGDELPCDTTLLVRDERPVAERRLPATGGVEELGVRTVEPILGR